ncbi:MAG: hypothetical protein FJW27_16285 [Acidimicrobiia bacterium]|nr:hypothetical protein [Acidimicrobiia bacterium]
MRLISLSRGVAPLHAVHRTLKTILAAALFLPSLAQAQIGPAPGSCAPGALPGGALSLICVPSTGWNGELVVFAHGYVDRRQPLNFYNLNLPDGTPLPLLV